MKLPRLRPGRVDGKHDGELELEQADEQLAEVRGAALEAERRLQLLEARAQLLRRGAAS